MNFYGKMEKEFSLEFCGKNKERDMRIILIFLDFSEFV